MGGDESPCGTFTLQCLLAGASLSTIPMRLCMQQELRRLKQLIEALGELRLCMCDGLCFQLVWLAPTLTNPSTGGTASPARGSWLCNTCWWCNASSAGIGKGQAKPDKLPMSLFVVLGHFTCRLIALSVVKQSLWLVLNTYDMSLLNFW